MRGLLFLLVLSLTCFACEESSSTQEQEARELEELFAEIEHLSTSIPCESTSSWAFTTYGHKACGGPSRYIAFSLQIDTEDFLQRVAVHATKAKHYNQRWGATSDCSIPPSPTGIDCENAKAILIYD